MMRNPPTHHTDMILEELWRDDRCRARMIEVITAPGPSASSSAAPAPASAGQAPGQQQQGGEGGVFYQYASCLLNSLIYLFKVGAVACAESAQKETCCGAWGSAEPANS